MRRTTRAIMRKHISSTTAHVCATDALNQILRLIYLIVELFMLALKCEPPHVPNPAPPVNAY